MAKNAPPAAAKVAQQPAAPAELFRNSAIPYIAIALAVAGIVLGFILTRNFFQHNIMGEASGCAINAYVDCDRVSQSTFAAIGPVPISAFGLGMHGAVLMALAVAHFRGARVREGLVGGAAALALAATAVSVVLAAISLFVIKALCVYCTALQIVNLALAGTLVFGLTGGVERLKQALRSIGGPALGAGVLAIGVGAGATAIATYSLATGADKQFLERQILEARESQRLADRYLSFERHEFELSDSPQLGDPDAPITLVVFADYNCPHCQAFDPRIPRSHARPTTCGWCTSSSRSTAPATGPFRRTGAPPPAQPLRPPTSRTWKASSGSTAKRCSRTSSGTDRIRWSSMPGRWG